MREIVFSVIVFLLSGAAFKFYKDSKQSELRYQSLIGITEEAVLLKGNILQLKTEYKKSEDLLAETSKKFKELKIEYDEKIKLVGSLGLSIKGRQTADSVIRIDETDSPEICYTEEGKLGLYSFRISQDLAVIKEEKTGKQRVVIKGYYILDPSVKSKWAGVPYQLIETTGEVKIDPTESQGPAGLIYFPLNLNLGINTGSQVLGTVTLLGLGRSKEDLDYKLLSIGAGYDGDKLRGLVTLVSARLVPDLLTNSYIGVDYSQDNKLSLSLSVGL